MLDDLVSPCCPGYLAVVVAGDDASRMVRLGRALLAAALMTAGFVVVFGPFGLISTPVASAAQRYLPRPPRSRRCSATASRSRSPRCPARSGPFLAVAGVALRRGDPVAYLAYALGMGLVVAVLAVAAALASTAVTAGVRRLLPYVGRVGGALVLLTAASVLFSLLRRGDRAGMGRWGRNR